MNAAAEFIASTTQLNRIGASLGRDAGVHAVTDVTGFGLLGHALEMARGSAATLVIEDRAVPLLAQAETLAREGRVTGASGRNWASYGHAVALPSGTPEWRRQVLTDPQTSGGLLVACDPARAEDLLRSMTAAGFLRASLIGRVEQGAPGVRVEA